MSCRYLITTVMVLLFAVSCVSSETSTERNVTDHHSQASSAAKDSPVIPDGHNSRNALDWAGTYSGVLPCASCPGIETVVTLHSDGVYERSMRYLDESGTQRTDTGTFTWNQAGSKIELDTDNDEIVKYQVGENQLFQLDRDGQRVDSALAAHYVLQKHLQDIAIENKRWKLVELRGSAVESERDAVLKLDAEGAVASGHSSCNAFSGTYVIKSGQRIRFSHNVAATLMACPNMRIEQTFFEVLRMTDNYSVSEEGQLSLNRARMAPLARFELIE